MGEEKVLGSIIGLSLGSADETLMVPLEMGARMAGVNVT